MLTKKGITHVIIADVSVVLLLIALIASVFCFHAIWLVMLFLTSAAFNLAMAAKEDSST